MNQTLQRAFLADITLHPDDDTGRLIYADWLAEEGQDDRADFIRLAIELWNYPVAQRSIFNPRETRTADICHELEATLHRNDWGKTPAALEVSWRRGFVDSVRCETQAWLEHGPELCAEHPVREVRLTDWELHDSRAGHAQPHIVQPAWYWMLPRSSRVPPELYQRLVSRDNRSVLFETEAAARETLSAFCIAWARNPLASQRLIEENAKRKELETTT